MGEFAQNYERALSGYTNDAGQINSNLAAWRSDVDMTRQANKTGFAAARSQAYNKVDMDAIKGVADEFGLQGGKKLFEKYVTKGVLESKFGGLTNRSFNDVDKELGNRFKGALKRKLGIGQSVDEGGAKTEAGESGGGFSDFIKGKFGGTTEQATQRLNNLRSDVGETKSSISGLVKSKVNSVKAQGVDDEGVEMQPTDDLTNSNSLLRSDPYGREAVSTSGLTDADKGRGFTPEEAPVEVPPARPDYIRDPDLVRNPPLSDRVAGPEAKPEPNSLEDLKGRFAALEKPRGGSVQMGDVGDGRPTMVRQSSQGFNDVDRSDSKFSAEPTEAPPPVPDQAPARDPFEGMDFGEFKGQGGAAPRSDPMDFQKEPSLKPDALGGGNGGQSVATRNTAGSAEQDATRVADDGSDLAPYYQGLNRPSLVNATGDQAGNLGQQALKEGGEGAGSLLGDAAKVAGSDAAETGAGSALETAGAVLDATPFAPLGWLFGAVGLGLDGAAAYQAGKGVADWVSTDILHNHPAVNFTKAKLPGRASIPKSFSITPTMDSSMDIGSGGGSW